MQAVPSRPGPPSWLPPVLRFPDTPAPLPAPSLLSSCCTRHCAFRAVPPPPHPPPKKKQNKTKQKQRPNQFPVPVPPHQHLHASMLHPSFPPPPHLPSHPFGTPPPAPHHPARLQLRLPLLHHHTRPTPWLACSSACPFSSAAFSRACRLLAARISWLRSLISRSQKSLGARMPSRTSLSTSADRAGPASVWSLHRASSEALPCSALSADCALASCGAGQRAGDRA